MSQRDDIAVEAAAELDRDRDKYEKARQQLLAEPLAGRVVEILYDQGTTEYKLGRTIEALRPLVEAKLAIARRETLLRQVRTVSS